VVPAVRGAAVIVLGIDPGLSGAVAIMAQIGMEIHDMPTLALTRGGKNKREIDAALLADLIERGKPDHAFVEQVWAMPGQGVSGMFAFGKAYGIVIGILAALQIPVTFVPAQTWKKALRVPAAKDGARARASELLPTAAHYWTRVRDSGRAESALLSLYGANSLNGSIPK
jgi:crossover junction endodeoxyribonuclease RuvC